MTELKKAKTRSKKRKKKIPVHKTVEVIIVIGLILMFVNYSIDDKSVSRDYNAQLILTTLKSGNGEVTVNWEEKRFQQVLHRMTHQKVKAVKKHGAVQMTDSNIELMLEVLNQNKEKYKEADYYLLTLSKWKNRDFSEIGRTHDKLRKLQGLKDEDSRASSHSSKKEEEEFIETVFKH